jgi:hypothetical protein
MLVILLSQGNLISAILFFLANKVAMPVIPHQHKLIVLLMVNNQILPTTALNK